jgi:hypothetical protein
MFSRVFFSHNCKSTLLKKKEKVKFTMQDLSKNGAGENIISCNATPLSLPQSSPLSSSSSSSSLQVVGNNVIQHNLSLLPQMTTHSPTTILGCSPVIDRQSIVHKDGICDDSNNNDDNSSSNNNRSDNVIVGNSNISNCKYNRRNNTPIGGDVENCAKRRKIDSLDTGRACSNNTDNMNSDNNNIASNSNNISDNNNINNTNNDNENNNNNSNINSDINGNAINTLGGSDDNTIKENTSKVCRKNIPQEKRTKSKIDFNTSSVISEEFIECGPQCTFRMNEMLRHTVNNLTVRDKRSIFLMMRSGVNNNSNNNNNSNETICTTTGASKINTQEDRKEEQQQQQQTEYNNEEVNEHFFMPYYAITMGQFSTFYTLLENKKRRGKSETAVNNTRTPNVVAR